MTAEDGGHMTDHFLLLEFLFFVMIVCIFDV